MVSAEIEAAGHAKTFPSSFNQASPNPSAELAAFVEGALTLTGERIRFRRSCPQQHAHFVCPARPIQPADLETHLIQIHYRKGYHS